MSTNENPEYVAWVKQLCREVGLRQAWQVVREANEYFDGEVEIEAAAKRRFFDAYRGRSE